MKTEKIMKNEIKNIEIFSWFYSLWYQQSSIIQCFNSAREGARIFSRVSRLVRIFCRQDRWKISWCRRTICTNARNSRCYNKGNGNRICFAIIYSLRVYLRYPRDNVPSLYSIYATVFLLIYPFLHQKMYREPNIIQFYSLSRWRRIIVEIRDS